MITTCVLPSICVHPRQTFIKLDFFSTPTQNHHFVVSTGKATTSSKIIRLIVLVHAYQINISIESNENSKKADGYFEFILIDINNKITFAVDSDIG